MSKNKYKYNINDLQLGIMREILKQDSANFTSRMLEVFPIQTICDMCGIDRNHYNYLVRSNQLNNIFFGLRYEVEKGKYR